MKVVVIGGGAAGMLASAVSAAGGAEVTLIEKNMSLGRKLYITGKGRCNVTNNVGVREFTENVVRNEKFLLSALNKFTPEDTVSLLERYGCSCKVERGNRVFPVSDKSSDVIKALKKFMDEGGVKVIFGTAVTNIVTKNCKVSGVETENGDIIAADKVILCAGGASYPATGSTGDGFNLAARVGHRIIDIRPALCPILLQQNVARLSGLTLKNVKVRVEYKGETVAERFGEMLFTADGVSGPIILTLSSYINDIKNIKEALLYIDLKPALTRETLDKRVIQDFTLYANKNFKNALSDLIPRALTDDVIAQACIDPDKKVNQLNKKERAALVDTLKSLCYNIESIGALDGAVVTAGGVDAAEIKPKNMESKLVGGLHFAGEVIDVDALTGGFNLQIAFSTAYLAAREY